MAEYIEGQIQAGDVLWLSLQPGATEVIVQDPVSFENFLYIGGSPRGEMVFANIMNLENTFVWSTGDQAFQPYRP